MSVKKVISPLVIAAIAAGSLLPLSSAANAGGRWGHHGAGSGADSHGSPSVQHYSRNVNRWGDVRQNRWNNEYSGYHHRDHTGRNVAIGVFAAILGLAIASEAGKVQHDYYDEQD